MAATKSKIGTGTTANATLQLLCEDKPLAIRDWNKEVITTKVTPPPRFPHPPIRKFRIS